MNHTSHGRLTALFLIASAILACGQFNWISTATPEPTETETPSPLPIPSDPEAGSAGLGDSLYPGFGNGGYQVEHYTLDITVHDVSTSDMTAVTSIEAKATQDLRQFNLDFIGFEINSITIDEEPAEYERSGQELTIVPSKPIANGHSFATEIQYAGSPEPLYSQALPFQTGWVTIEGGSFVLSEPDGSASFYPVNDHPLDKATYTFRVTVPRPFEVAANGVLTETIEEEDSTTFVFEMRDPMG
ncbi:MAG: M1 family metallopeptidase, partial [Chloroflexi bacterium]|nr:M1 family metallopeptidase [Chloroflexota bacterium]